MTLPEWVQDAIRKFQPPQTGKVIIELELYSNGVTKIEIGGIVRVKPGEKIDQPIYRASREIKLETN